MTAISMYKISVPIFVQFLTSLSAVLDKTAAYAEAKKVEPSVLNEVLTIASGWPAQWIATCVASGETSKSWVSVTAAVVSAARTLTGPGSARGAMGASVVSISDPTTDAASGRRMRAFRRIRWAAARAG